MARVPELAAGELPLADSPAVLTPPLLVDEREAARLLSVSVGTLQKWRVAGYGPRQAGGLGRCVRYPRAELERFVASLPLYQSNAEGIAAEGGE